jgi:LysR family transcriptional regulator, flagellar master operon regulator
MGAEMQVELARTFLEVVTTGSFVAAAERLHVTQSTVSTRIQALEQELGRPLFLRNKAGAVLTPAGTQFQRHAIAIIRLWEQARQDASVPAGHTALLRIGGEAGLWNRLLYKWVPWMRANARNVALRCELGLSDGLIHNLVEGLLDIGVMYAPQSRPGLVVDVLVQEELVLLEAPAPAEQDWPGDHIYVDWGQEFHRSHRLRFPDRPSPGLFVGLGTLGFEHMLRHGGSGYFPRTLASPHLASGRVRISADAPTFMLPIYVVHPADASAEVIAPALAGLRAIVRTEQAQAARASQQIPARGAVAKPGRKRKAARRGRR